MSAWESEPGFFSTANSIAAPVEAQGSSATLRANDENGPLCSCGNNGCLETVASCAAIIQAVRIAIEQGIDSKIRDLANGDLDRISIELIAQAAAENDSLAFRVLQKAAFLHRHRPWRTWLTFSIRVS